MRSNVCTKSSSDGSKRRPCCRRLTLRQCCSGRCSPLDRSTCGKLTVGRRLQQSPSISQLTSLPDQVLSKCRRSRHPKFQHKSRRHLSKRHFSTLVCKPPSCKATEGATEGYGLMSCSLGVRSPPDAGVLGLQAPVMLFRSAIGLAMVRSVSKPSPVPRIVTVP